MIWLFLILFIAFMVWLNLKLEEKLPARNMVRELPEMRKLLSKTIDKYIDGGDVLRSFASRSKGEKEMLLDWAVIVHNDFAKLLRKKQNEVVCNAVNDENALPEPKYVLKISIKLLLLSSVAREDAGATQDLMAEYRMLALFQPIPAALAVLVDGIGIPQVPADKISVMRKQMEQNPEEGQDEALLKLFLEYRSGIEPLREASRQEMHNMVAEIESFVGGLPFGNTVSGNASPGQCGRDG